MISMGPILKGFEVIAVMGTLERQRKSEDNVLQGNSI